MGGFLPYGRQTIDEADISAVIEVLRGEWLTQGPLVERFERAIGEYVSCANVSVVSSGTAALHVAYAALGLSPDDEIVTSPITFVATANAARYLGAEVRFCGVHPETGNIDAATVEAALGPRTKGISVVHLGGLPADLGRIREIADRHGLWVVEDASHALGASYRGTKTGSCSLSEATTFSFHPVKHLTTGEGGAVTFRDPEMKRSADQLRHHGIERDPARFESPSPGPWFHEIPVLGWNYRLTDFQCALGISQLAKQANWLRRRRELASRYRTKIAAHFQDLVRPQGTSPDTESAYHLFPVLIDFVRAGLDRGTVMDRLRREGIGTQVHYIPVHRQPYYRQRYGDLKDGPGVREYYERELSLPMYPTLLDSEVDRVVEVLEKVLKMGTGG